MPVSIEGDFVTRAKALEWLQKNSTEIKRLRRIPINYLTVSESELLLSASTWEHLTSPEYWVAANIRSKYDLLGDMELSAPRDVLIAAVNSLVHHFSEHLQFENYPLKMLNKFDGELDTPVKFVALLLTLLDKGIPPDELLTTGLLTRYFVRHPHETDTIQNTYKLLAEIRDPGQEPIKKILTILDTSGAKLRGMLAYNLRGDNVAHELQFYPLESIPNTFDLTAEKENLDALCALFAPRGELILLSEYKKLQESKHEVIQQYLRDRFERLSTDEISKVFYQLSHEIAPELRKHLLPEGLNYVSNEVILNLLYTKTDITWIILSLKPDLLATIPEKTIEKWLEDIPMRPSNIKYLLILTRDVNMSPYVEKILDDAFQQCINNPSLLDDKTVPMIMQSSLEVHQWCAEKSQNLTTSLRKFCRSNLPKNHDEYITLQDAWRVHTGTARVLRVLTQGAVDSLDGYYALKTMIIEESFEHAKEQDVPFDISKVLLSMEEIDDETLIRTIKECLVRSSNRGLLEYLKTYFQARYPVEEGGWLAVFQETLSGTPIFNRMLIQANEELLRLCEESKSDSANTACFSKKTYGRLVGKNLSDCMSFINKPMAVGFFFKYCRSDDLDFILNCPIPNLGQETVISWTFKHNMHSFLALLKNISEDKRLELMRKPLGQVYCLQYILQEYPSFLQEMVESLTAENRVTLIKNLRFSPTETFISELLIKCPEIFFKLIKNLPENLKMEILLNQHENAQSPLECDFLSSPPHVLQKLLSLLSEEEKITILTALNQNSQSLLSKILSDDKYQPWLTVVLAELPSQEARLKLLSHSNQRGLTSLHEVSRFFPNRVPVALNLLTSQQDKEKVLLVENDMKHTPLLFLARTSPEVLETVMEDYVAPEHQEVALQKTDQNGTHILNMLAHIDPLMFEKLMTRYVSEMNREQILAQQSAFSDFCILDEVLYYHPIKAVSVLKTFLGKLWIDYLTAPANEVGDTRLHVLARKEPEQCIHVIAAIVTVTGDCSRLLTVNEVGETFLHCVAERMPHALAHIIKIIPPKEVLSLLAIRESLYNHTAIHNVVWEGSKEILNVLNVLDVDKRLDVLQLPGQSDLTVAEWINAKSPTMLKDILGCLTNEDGITLLTKQGIGGQTLLHRLVAQNPDELCVLISVRASNGAYSLLNTLNAANQTVLSYAAQHYPYALGPLLKLLPLEERLQCMDTWEQEGWLTKLKKDVLAKDAYYILCCDKYLHFLQKKLADVSDMTTEAMQWLKDKIHIVEYARDILLYPQTETGGRGGKATELFRQSLWAKNEEGSLILMVHADGQVDAFLKQLDMAVPIALRGNSIFSADVGENFRSDADLSDESKREPNKR